MDASDQLRRRRSLQERLGLACCGSTWGGGATTMSIQGEEEDDLVEPLTDEIPIPIPIPVPNLTLQEPNLAPDCVSPSPRMNLAAALEAERNSRSTEPTLAPLTEDNLQIQVMTPATPTRVSLMRLLEETDDQDEKEGVGRDMVCCVCMGRKKGAAFIPCGHTFCRVCSRELWLNRGSCPLCNRLILEILDIF